MFRFIKKNAFFLFFALCTAIASYTAGNYAGFLVFIMSVLLIYIVPGIAIQKYLKSLTYSDYNKVILSSFAVGYSFSLVLYIICLFLELQQYVIFLSIIVTITSLLYIRKDMPSLYYMKACNTIFLIGIFALAFGVSYVCYQLNNLMPEQVGWQDYYPDYMYHLKNAVAATKGYPLPDLSVWDNKLFYHYFSMVGMANLRYVTGIELFDLCYTYSYLINLVLLIGAIYICVSYYIKNPLLHKLVILAILFTTSWETLLVTNYIPQLYSSMASSSGIALSVYSYYFFKKYFVEKELCISLILPILFFFVAIGTKAPFALIVLIGILFSLFVYGLQEKAYKKVFIIGLVYCVTFTIVMILFVWNMMPAFERTPHDNVVISYMTVFQTGFYTLLKPLFQFIPNIGLKVFVCIIFYVLLNSFLLLTWGAIVLRHSNEIRWAYVDYGIGSICITGYLLFLFTSQICFSQTYFYFITIPFSFILLGSIIDNNNLLLGKLEKIILCVVTICGGVFFAYSIRCYIISNKVFDGHETMVISGNSLDVNELEALRWVRDHTNSDAILLSNKIRASKMGRRSYVVSAFTERQVFLEGYEYSASPKDSVIADRRAHILNMFENNTDESAYFKKNGVTHLVLFKNLIDEKTKIIGNVIYENASVVVTSL